jgi:hypothetical protein
MHGNLHSLGQFVRDLFDNHDLLENAIHSRVKLTVNNYNSSVP